MTTRNVTTSLPRRSRTAEPALLKQLRARVEALGFEFWRTCEKDEFGMYVGDPNNREIVFIETFDGGAPELESWLDDRETERERAAVQKAGIDRYADFTAYTALKTRVAALGHKLITYNTIEGPGADYTSLYVLDPRTDEIVIVTAGGEKADEYRVAAWCEMREAGAGERAKANGASDASAERDPYFGTPPVGFENAAKWLAELGARSEKLPLDKIVAALVGAGWDVMEQLGIGENGETNEYRIAHGWTEKGVRHQWAELQLIGALYGFTDVVRPDGKGVAS